MPQNNGDLRGDSLNCVNRTQRGCQDTLGLRAHRTLVACWRAQGLATLPRNVRPDGRRSDHMTSALRNTGIEPVGEMPWAAHFCHFYETRDDLLDPLLPYFKAGLESNEFCAWVVSEPVTEDGAWE